MAEQKAKANPFDKVLKEIPGLPGKKYYAFSELNDQRVSKLPYTIKILLECALRNCDEFNIHSSDVEKILNWEVNSKKDIEIPFKPARVLLQDFTGVPLVVDLAAMRDAIKRLGGNPSKINPACQVDLVIDHSIQVEFAKTLDALQKNEELEFHNNKERFEFLKWGQSAFENFRIVPPGSGIVHQVNLEYLARGVFEDNKGVLYPDTVVGTDSHTTMINGLGVLGWGVGGIEAESNMLGECSAMVLPEVVGFYFSGELPKTATATDLVLTCTSILRKRGVVGKFVEFFGPGLKSLSLSDRATVANMAPEYGATTGFFPVDEQTLAYLRLTGRTNEQIKAVESYYKAQGLFRTYDSSETDPVYSGEILKLDLSTVVPSLAGPKRPQDHVALSNVQKEFSEGLTKPVTFKSYGITEDKANLEVKYQLNGKEFTFKHGQVLIAAITSCTNTSNPGVMLAAGLVAKNAAQRGLKVPDYVKTSLSPGSQVVSSYYEKAGLTEFLNQLGFTHAGYGCMTCIGNSGDFIDPVLNQVVKDNDFVAAAVLSGNRNFEGRVHPQTRANYLASPPLVVAYALAGNVNFNFDTQPLGKDTQGKDVFLKDIWPSREEVEQIANKIINPEMFIDNYSRISKGTDRWNNLQVKQGIQYEWKEESTYIHNPPFFNCELELAHINNIENAYVLGNFGDSITTDHISPAGNIAKDSPAGRYLLERGVDQKDFNSYGTRRGNDEIMARGTFANVRIVNKLLNGKVGPNTVHIPTGEVLPIFDAAQRYIQAGIPTIILGGKEYGTGSSRDWAAKGPFLQGVKVVIAQTYERIHRSNLIGMGILPLEFKDGESADTLGLTGKERFSIDLQGGNLKVNQEVTVKVDNGKNFTTKCRLDTDVEVQYYKNGGILLYVLRKLATSK